MEKVRREMGQNCHGPHECFGTSILVFGTSKWVGDRPARNSVACGAASAQQAPCWGPADSLQNHSRFRRVPSEELQLNREEGRQFAVISVRFGCGAPCHGDMIAR